MISRVAQQLPVGALLASLPERGRGVWHRLTRRSSSNFAFAFLFLGPQQRAALEQVYEFCRVVDDVVDERRPGPEGVKEARAALGEWSREIARVYGDAYMENDPPRTELGRALAETRALFHYPREGFDEIIAGVAMDLDRDRYPDQDSLRLYCYRVASCVGLLCIPIFGDQGPDARTYAIHLGLALQYTNILRDVGEDAGRGRVYLPEDLLHKHGLRREDVLNFRYDDRFVAMAAEFAKRAEREYRLAWEQLDRVDRRAMLPAEIMGRTYYKVLQRIRDRNYNVFTRRASLRRRDKLGVAAAAIARLGLSPG